MAQSRTDFKSEIDHEKGTTTFTRKESEDGQTSRGGGDGENDKIMEF